MIFHENRLPADDSHEISCLIILEKVAKIWNCRLMQIIGGALQVKYILLAKSFPQILQLFGQNFFLFLFCLLTFNTF